jgi:hypothetical protein
MAVSSFSPPPPDGRLDGELPSFYPSSPRGYTYWGAGNREWDGDLGDLEDDAKLWRYDMLVGYFIQCLPVS